MANREISKKEMKQRKQDIIENLRDIRQSRSDRGQNQMDSVEDATAEPVQQVSQIQILSPVEYLEYVATKEEFSPSAIAAASPSITMEPLDPTATASSSSTSELRLGPVTMPKSQKQFRSSTTTHPLPLSPLDEVKNQLVDLQTSPSPQMSQMTTEMSDVIPSTSSRFPQHQYSQYPQQINYKQTDKMQSPIPYTNESEISSGSIPVSTSSPVIPPGLLLNKNRSRHSTPKLESVPSIQPGYTAQIQRSNSPLRQEFQGTGIDIQNNSSKYEFNMDYDFIPNIGENYDYYTSSSIIPYNPEPSTSTTFQQQFSQDQLGDSAQPTRYDDSSTPPVFTHIQRSRLQPRSFPQQHKSDSMLVSRGSMVTHDPATRVDESILQTEFRLASGDPDDPLLNDGDEDEEILENVDDEGTTGNKVSKEHDENIVVIDVENEEEGYEIIDRSGYESLEGGDSVNSTRVDRKILKEGTSSRGVQIPRNVYIPINRQGLHQNGGVDFQQSGVAQETHTSQTVQQQDNGTSPVSPVTPNTPDTLLKSPLSKGEKKGKPKQGTWLFVGVIAIGVVIIILSLISKYSSDSGPFNFISGIDAITVRSPSPTASPPNV